MIQDVGNIELFELLETDPKTQCKACLSYWNVGIVFCTCGHFLQKETEVNRKFVQYTMNILSLPEYVIKKGRLHGHRFGKKPGDKTNYVADQLKKKCQKKKFQGINDRFFWCHDFRVRMIENNRGEVCRRWDLPADEDHTCHLSEEEYLYCKNKWWLHLNKSGSDTLPLRNVLISSKRCLFWNVHTKKMEENISRSTPYWKNKQWQLAQSSSSTWWELARFLVVFLKFRRSTKRQAMSFTADSGLL